MRKKTKMRVNLALCISVILLAMIGLFFMMDGWFKKIHENMQNNFETYQPRGYASMEDDYIMPTTYTDFITQEENDHIMNLANSNFTESVIISGDNPEGIRKSQTAWLDRNDPIIGRIIQRVCDMTNIPFENSESMQIVKYETGGYYREHYDSACDDNLTNFEFQQSTGQRIVTMLIYLNEDYKGGATYFPNLGQSFRMPKNGSVLFYNLENKEQGRCHPYALHTGIDILSGTKYIANVWLRELPVV